MSTSVGPAPVEKADNLGAGAAIGTGAAAATEDALELAAVARVADLRFLAASCDAERLLSLRLRALRDDAGAGVAMFLRGSREKGRGGNHPPHGNPGPRAPGTPLGRGGKWVASRAVLSFGSKSLSPFR